MFSYFWIILISHQHLESTYGLQVSFKGDLSALHYQEGWSYQLLEGFYIRDATGLDRTRPSWTHERILGPVIWFDVVSENWKVGFPGTFGPLRSSISHDNRDLQKSMNWSYIDIKGKWTISSDISVQAGMY